MQGFLLTDAGDAEGDGISLDEAILLIEEIGRLQAQLAECQSRIGELNHLAHWDPVVNLANRRSFVGALERLVARTARHGGGSAMLFVDVDGLKTINDRFGHGAGDKALGTIAQLLVAGVRKTDLVARLSGDEFGILLDEADELSAWQTALRIIEIVDDYHYSINCLRVRLGVAIGVAVIQPDDTPETVVTRADTEMYRIKAIGSEPGRPPPALRLQHASDKPARIEV